MKSLRILNRRTLTRYLLQAVALGAIASVGVFLFTVRDDTWQQIKQFHWPMLPVLFATVVVAWMCNGGRILVLARALGYKMNYRQAISVSLWLNSASRPPRPGLAEPSSDWPCCVRPTYP